MIAARHLLDRLAALGEPPTVLILHDFDVSGFTIRGTLAGEGGRYTYANRVKFIDIGLRLTDVEAWGLKELSEPVVYKGDFDNHVETLRRYGATEKEIEFLRTRRVELNAFLARTLIDYLEVKFREHGVEKVVPDAETMARVWRAASERELLRAKMAKVEAAARREAEQVAPPPDLSDRVRQRLAERPHLSWDEAVAEIVGETVGNGRKAR